MSDWAYKLASEFGNCFEYYSGHRDLNYGEVAKLIRERCMPWEPDNTRCRRITQVLIEEIGSVGPENAEQAVERAINQLRQQKAQIAEFIHGENHGEPYPPIGER